jgi:hypothetical protein
MIELLDEYVAEWLLLSYWMIILLNEFSIDQLF